MFCTHCGARLGTEARFCGQCGQAVRQPAAIVTNAPLPPPPPTSVAAVAPEPATSEAVLGVIPLASWRQGMLGLGSFSCTVIVTSRRLIIAELTAAIRQQAAQQAMEQAKAQGQGWRGRAAAVWQSDLGYADRYRHQSPDSILAESPRNVAIERSALRGIRLDNPNAFRSTDDQRATNTQRRMILTTEREKHVIDYPDALHDATVRLLAEAQMLSQPS